MAFIPKPQFPNVPKLPGVPQLSRSLLPEFAAGPAPVLNTAIAVGRLVLALTTKPTWGVYKASQPQINPVQTTEEATDPDGLAVLDEVVVTPPPPPVIVPDNFSRLQYEQEWDLTTAPLQEGAFAQFNKVGTPFQIKLRMTKGGTLKERQEFLDKLETIGASLDLYKIVTPERTYNEVNIQGIRLVREGAVGAYFFAEVEITFIQIRQVTAQYNSTATNTANAKNPSAQPPTNRGILNAITPASRVQTAINTVLAPLRSLAAVLGG